MPYRPRQLVTLAAAAAAATIVLLAGLRFMPASLYGIPPRLQEFLFERTAVQWITLFVFHLAVVIAIHRLKVAASLSSSTRRIPAAGEARGRGGAGSLARRLEELRTCLASQGRAAAGRRFLQMVEEDEERLSSLQGLTGGCIHLMLALGFFGTVWGISQSMSGAFGHLDDVTLDRLRAGLSEFSGALGTALDTTLLALACSLVASVLLAISRGSEAAAGKAANETIRRELGIDPADAGDGAVLLEAFRQQLASVGSKLASDCAESMRAIVSRGSATWETTMNDALGRHLVRLRDHEARVASELAEALRGQVSVALKILEELEARRSAALVAELKTIGRELRHAPEISIRYPNGNGRQDRLGGAP